MATLTRLSHSIHFELTKAEAASIVGGLAAHLADTGGGAAPSIWARIGGQSEHWTFILANEKNDHTYFFSEGTTNGSPRHIMVMSRSGSANLITRLVSKMVDPDTAPYSYLVAVTSVVISLETPSE